MTDVEPKSKAGRKPIEPNPLGITNQEFLRLGWRTELELKTEENGGVAPKADAFSARVFAQVSLPYRNPGDVPYWQRRNGDITLTVQPAVINNPKMKEPETAYPFGIVPRRILTWMASEVLMNPDKRELELGSSMTQFMSKIDLHRNGQNIKSLHDALHRLFGSRLSVQGLGSTDEGHGSVTEYFQVADSVQLWFTDRDADPNMPGLWASKVTLSQQFYDSILKDPVPIYIGALKALGSSPLRYDMLLWLTHRVYKLEASSESMVRVTWDQLNMQFGAQYGQLRSFRDKFRKELKAVQEVYPDLQVDASDTRYLIIKRSKTLVPPTRKERELYAGS